MLDPLPYPASASRRAEHYAALHDNVVAMLDGEDDSVAAMATIAAELHHALSHLSWTGFYRTIAPELLAVGPYQGGHGCLRIPYAQGVCGAAARTGRSQLVPDVHAFPGHIACSTTTRSELVVPVRNAAGVVTGVLDLDSDEPDAFDELDQHAMERLVRTLERFDRL
jgi:GAF domain-containing protein